jgi:predicted O-methyltransferase YrrM
LRREEFSVGFASVTRLMPGAVPASLAQRERILLYSLVYGLAPTYALEVGSYRGGSAAIISGALDDIALSGKLLCIEPHMEGVEPEMQAITAHNTTFVQGFFPDDLPAEFDGCSTEGLFEFCFYDALHDYENVLAHVSILPKWMRPGGFIVCHDGYHEPQARGMKEAAANVGLIDCGMLTRCANDLTDPSETYGGMRLFRVPGELPPNS